MKCNSSKQCHRSGPVTRNAYFNFLRDFRKQHCGLTAVEIVKRGARVWRCMNPSQKNKYAKMACGAPKIKRKKSRRC